MSDSSRDAYRLKPFPVDYQPKEAMNLEKMEETVARDSCEQARLSRNKLRNAKKPVADSVLGGWGLLRSHGLLYRSDGLGL